MKYRRQIGWLVAEAYAMLGIRAAICRKCRRKGLIVPILMHAPRPDWLAEILAELKCRVGLKRVELTFDDGRKVLKDIVPILERFNVSATFFISPGEIFSGYNWAEERHGLRLPNFSTLCGMSSEKRLALFESAFDLSGRWPSGNSLLSVEDIAELAKHPLVEIGNHTWSHMSCKRRPASEALEEIERAQKQIAEWTGKVPTKFSYPFGHGNDFLDASLRARGLTPYWLRPGLVTEATRGSARNMAYEDMTVNENIGRLLTAWPKVEEMPS